MYISIDTGGDFAALEFGALEDIVGTTTTKTFNESSCGPPALTTSTADDPVFVYEITDGYWKPGTTPGSIVAYGSNSSTGSYSATHHWSETVTWRFTNQPDVRLIIDATNLDSWRPMATLWNGSGSEPTIAGATLQINATLDPKPSASTLPLPKAQKITFRLTSSNVLGTAMNSPRLAPENSPQDLQFEASLNTPLVFVDKNTLHTPTGLIEDAAATLSSFDWGAYGEVTAEALLEDGTTIVARFRNTGEPMRIPKRQATSYIADSWKSAHGVSNLDDSSDNETLLGGDGHSGDGLTLYEEYRGMVANGQRVEPNPTKVDYHVYNGYSASDPVQSQKRQHIITGIMQFAALADLQPHYDYGLADFTPSDSFNDNDPSKRIINFNALTEGLRHRTDQHLVMIMPSLSLTKSKAHFGPSVPRNISRVELASSLGDSQIPWTTAHELAHTANVPHHGDHGQRIAIWERSGSTVTEKINASDSGITIQVHSESTGISVPGSILPPSQIMIISHEVTNSQHGSIFGGDETCLMRQPIATAVHWDRWPLRRYVIEPHETPGTDLCTDRLGKTFNKDQNMYPQPVSEPHPSRHGDAAPQRGNCREKICVNDYYNHPPYYGGGVAPEEIP
ncbi:hypothetical protein [Myxococcus xanthus]|uniref:hypothetical protein n=1 Tax=Myxococcus xanthus TaxID=34 RepID=UPI00112A773C|nr:hypothetical protein [Myxococcus xanthus]